MLSFLKLIRYPFLITCFQFLIFHLVALPLSAPAASLLLQQSEPEPGAALGTEPFPESLANELGLSQAPGARIFWVAAGSAADKAGLQLGDRIVQIDDQKIANFDDLDNVLAQFKRGQKFTIQFVRAEQQMTAMSHLPLFNIDRPQKTYQSGLQVLLSYWQQNPNPRLLWLILETYESLGQREAAFQFADQAMPQFAGYSWFQERRLELLRQAGRLEQFTEEAAKVAAQFPDVTPLKLSQLAALFAKGEYESATELALQIADLDAIQPGGTITGWTQQAVLYWGLARLRQGKSLANGEIDRAMNQGLSKASSLAVFREWRQMLKGAATYRLDPKSTASTIPLEQAKVLLGLFPISMQGITIKINGVDVPIAIIDTGALHTLISAETARRCGVELGKNEQKAFGSLSFIAKPGLIRELQIGSIILRDVPISVGNAPPLVLSEAKAALGIDLMHHLRFTLRYADKKVDVAPTAQAKPLPVLPSEQAWDIPLYPFPEHCLSEAKLSDGRYARTLIDSGNFAYTLVWPTWGHANLPDHAAPTESMFVYMLRQPRTTLTGISIAGRDLPDWPAMSMPPITLQGVDLLDLLMGHDLLSNYDVTIDMTGRKLRLQSPGTTVQKPRPNSLLEWLR